MDGRRYKCIGMQETKMLKALHAQESKKAAREKAKTVVEQRRSIKLKEVTEKVEDGTEEILTYAGLCSAAPKLSPNGATRSA